MEHNERSRRLKICQVFQPQHMSEDIIICVEYLSNSVPLIKNKTSLKSLNKSKYLHAKMLLHSTTSSDSINPKTCLPFQIAVWNSYGGMNLTEKSSREKNINVTDSLANRTLIVTTILVRRLNGGQRREGGGGGGGHRIACGMCEETITEENTAQSQNP